MSKLTKKVVNVKVQYLYLGERELVLQNIIR